ncbi:MAG TPA: hypothetical protein VK933_05220 [Longimicrobiales bacterium]|nr:hypothetical protein [Longimicrobiales bacterium]
MRVALLLSLAVIGTSACSRTMATAVPGGSPSSVSTERADRDDSRNGTGNGRGQPARGPRKLNGVPPGHYPKPGECRIWHSGRPPGQQPKPTACSNLMGRVPAGAFILYGDKAWDSRYDWSQDRTARASVPKVILDILGSMR